MAAPLTQVSLCNRALAKYGAGAILSLDDATKRGTALKLTYETVIDGLLSEYPWTFTRDMRRLQQAGDETPDQDGFLMAGWRFAYGLPGDLLGLPEKYLTDPRREGQPVNRFQVISGLVYCDETPLYCLGRFRIDEASWPPYFVKAAVDCLAAETVMLMSGNSGLLENLQAQAWGTPGEDRRGGSLGAAKRMDARAAGVSRLPPDPLTAARFA